MTGMYKTKKKHYQNAMVEKENSKEGTRQLLVEFERMLKNVKDKDR